MANKNNATVYFYFTLEGSNLDFLLLNQHFLKYDCYSSPKGSIITKMHHGEAKRIERTLDFFQVKLYYSKIDMETFHRKALEVISETIENSPSIIAIIRENLARIWCSVYPKYCMFGFEVTREMMRVLLEFDITLEYTITNP